MVAHSTTALLFSLCATLAAAQIPSSAPTAAPTYDGSASGVRWSPLPPHPAPSPRARFYDGAAACANSSAPCAPLLRRVAPAGYRATDRYLLLLRVLLRFHRRARLHRRCDRARLLLREAAAARDQQHNCSHADTGAPDANGAGRGGTGASRVQCGIRSERITGIRRRRGGYCDGRCLRRAGSSCGRVRCGSSTRAEQRRRRVARRRARTGRSAARGADSGLRDGRVPVPPVRPRRAPPRARAAGPVRSAAAGRRRPGRELLRFARARSYGAPARRVLRSAREGASRRPSERWGDFDARRGGLRSVYMSRRSDVLPAMDPGPGPGHK